MFKFTNILLFAVVVVVAALAGCDLLGAADPQNLDLCHVAAEKTNVMLGNSSPSAEQIHELVVICKAEVEKSPHLEDAWGCFAGADLTIPGIFRHCKEGLDVGRQIVDLSHQSDVAHVAVEKCQAAGAICHEEIDRWLTAEERLSPLLDARILLTTRGG